MRTTLFTAALCLTTLALAPTAFGTGTSDNCATPMLITGTGTFAFDNSTATTGTQGQMEQACPFSFQPGIANDVWISWTATATGFATLRSCGGTTVDTKVAVYAGTGCPSSGAIACNDSACGLQTRLSFATVLGQPYTIQLGSYPGTPGGTGTFTLDVDVPPGCEYDDGTSEQWQGNGGDVVWFNRFGTAGQTTTVPSLSIAYGTPASILDGQPVTLVIWDDPNDDGNPDDLVLVATAGTTISAAGTDTFVSGSFAAPVVVQGVYYAGAFFTYTPGVFVGVASMDQSQGSAGRSWFSGGPAGTVDLTNLNVASIPPMNLDEFQPGVWLVRANCSETTGSTVCAGTAALCPCGNGGAAGNGCANSLHANGAHLSATGRSMLADDTLVLHASDMSAASSPAWVNFVQASTLATPIPFGDGLSCLSGSLVRLGTRAIAGGASDFGHGVGSDPNISIQGLVSGPGTRHYQAVYRNQMPFCTAATFNITNGVSIVWN